MILLAQFNAPTFGQITLQLEFWYDNMKVVGLMTGLGPFCVEFVSLWVLSRHPKLKEHACDVYEEL